jgi:hypothetical protein
MPSQTKNYGYKIKTILKAIYYNKIKFLMPIVLTFINSIKEIE